jgi:hypothetical protein
MGAAQLAMQASLAIVPHRGCSGYKLCKLLPNQRSLFLNRIPPLRTLAFLVLLHVFLCETEFFALFDM